MKVTLTHNGKSVELDLTAEQMTALGLKEEKKKTGYERSLAHYYVNSFGSVVQSCAIDNLDYDAANHYSDEDLALANARADRLMRQLRRFAAENGGIPSVEDWDNHDKDKFFIGLDYPYSSNKLHAYVVCNAAYVSRHFGNIYFNDKEACNKAVEKFHDELIWYFTEYEAMLR